MSSERFAPLGRASAILTAMLVCGWFALGYHQASSLARAEAIIYAQPFTTAARARTAEQLLSDAQTLNPDDQVRVDRVHILLERHDWRDALPLAQSVVRDEPQNIEAWLWLAHSQETNAAGVLYALHRARELEPLVP